MDIDEARVYLVKKHKLEFREYILKRLAGDFAVALAEDHILLTRQLEAELKHRRDDCND